MANAILNVGQTGGQINISTAAAPATPAVGVVTLYAGTDKALHALNSDGTDITIAAAGAASPITVQQTNSLVSTAVGATALAGGSIAIGSTASARGLDTVVLGQNSIACGAGSIVIGKNSCQSLPDGQSVVIGNCACTNPGLDYGGQVVIGFCASGGYANPNVTIGYRAVGNTDSVAILNAGVGGASVAIGNASNTAGDLSVAIGRSAYAGAESVAVGACTTNQNGACSVAVGRQAISSSANSILMGYTPRVFCGATGAIVLGNSSVGGTGACDSIVLGNSACSTATNTIAIGSNAKTICQDNIAIGNTSCSTAASAIALGNTAKAEAACAIAIGNNACVTSGLSAIAIGQNSLASGGNVSVAIGYGSCAGDAAAAVGGGSVATGLAALSFGYSSCATGNYAINITQSGFATGVRSIAIGPGAQATNACAVALGNGITTEKDNTTHVNSLIAYGQAASKAHAVGSTGGTVAINWDNSNVQTLTLTSSATVSMSNPIDGGVYTLQITQGGTGSYTATWSNIKWPGGTPPTLSTAAGALDVLTFIYGPTAYVGNANLNFS